MADAAIGPEGGELELIGRITTASNATFLARIGDIEVVYKPIAGEQPLWDFPDATLAHREVAAHLVSEAFGWKVVPRTWLGDGPFGEGMLQLWHEVDRASDQDDGWLEVVEGYDDEGRPVTLVHENTAALRRMALFDVVVNNADRKGGHVLAMPDGHRYGVDHGLTFHVEHKLRTVLWGWVGEPLTVEELAALDRVRTHLGGALGAALNPLLSAQELTAFAGRIDRLRSRGTFPAPSGDMPAVPYPLF